MTVAQKREGLEVAREVPTLGEPRPTKGRVREIWPLFAVGLGFLATVAWIVLLSWLLYRAALTLVL